MSQDNSKEKIYPIEDLEMTLRCHNVLKQNGISCISELCNFSSRRILEFRNMGKKTLKEIREILANHGLALKDEIADLETQKILLQSLPNILIKIHKQAFEMRKEISLLEYKISVVIENLNKYKRD